MYFLNIFFTTIQAHSWLRDGIFLDDFAVQINPWYLLKCLCCRVSWVVWKKSMSLNNNIYTFKHCFSFRGKKFGLNWILIPKHPETSISNNCPKAVTQCPYPWRLLYFTIFMLINIFSLGRVQKKLVTHLFFSISREQRNKALQCATNWIFGKILVCAFALFALFCPLCPFCPFCPFALLK